MNEKYMVIGKDFQMYGPLDKRELHEMVRQGRADSLTKVKIVGTSAWRRLAELEGFFEENKREKTNSEPNAKTTPSDSHHSKKIPLENALRAELSKEDLGPDLTARQARLFVGKNADLFIQEWSLMHLANKKSCISWRIFLCSLAGPCWLSYRKMYKETLFCFVLWIFFWAGLAYPFEHGSITSLGKDIEMTLPKTLPMNSILPEIMPLYPIYMCLAQFKFIFTASHMCQSYSHDLTKAFWQKILQKDELYKSFLYKSFLYKSFQFIALVLLNNLVGFFGGFYYRDFAARKIKKIIDSYPVDQIEGEISNQGGTNVYACLVTTIFCVLLLLL